MRAQVTPSDRDAVRKAGKLTFRPLTGGRFTCVQLPQFRGLNRAGVASVRSQIGTITPPLNLPPEVMHETPEKYVKVPAGQTVYVECPYCTLRQEVSGGASRRCPGYKCNRLFGVDLVAAPVPITVALREATLDGYGTVRCPQCSRTNYGCHEPEAKHRCEWCGQDFKIRASIQSSVHTAWAPTEFRPSKPSAPPKSTINEFGEAACPRLVCGRVHWGVSPGLIACRSCGQSFEAVRKVTPTSNSGLRQSQINTDFDARCPLCQTLNINVRVGRRICDACDEAFEIVEHIVR